MMPLLYPYMVYVHLIYMTYGEYVNINIAYLYLHENLMNGE